MIITLRFQNRLVRVSIITLAPHSVHFFGVVSGDGRGRAAVLAEAAAISPEHDPGAAGRRGQPLRGQRGRAKVGGPGLAKSTAGRVAEKGENCRGKPTSVFRSSCRHVSSRDQTSPAVLPIRGQL
jgi:hypothetical protein